MSPWWIRRFQYRPVEWLWGGGRLGASATLQGRDRPTALTRFQLLVKMTTVGRSGMSTLNGWVVVGGLTLSLVCVETSASQDNRVDAPIPHDVGQSVSASFEGWYPNSDGTRSLLFGYFNRNYEEHLDIAVGTDNRFEPGPADRGQPTHFLPRRQTGVFAVVVPADFDGRLTWSLTSHGETVAIPGHIRPEWEITALEEVTSGNTPPVIRFDGPTGQGPNGTSADLSATVATPVEIPVWVTDDGVRKRRTADRPPRLGLVWSKYRGPGGVTIDETEPVVDERGRAVTTATFESPGDYVLRLLVWDDSGGQGTIMAGGFFCCWTNGYVNVHVE